MIRRNDSVNDDEEILRFQKAFAKCRYCNHPKMIHSLIPKRCVDARLKADGTYKQCRCKNFEPKDNLEFLEYRYDKKKGKGQ